MLRRGNDDDNHLDRNIVLLLFVSHNKSSNWHDWIFYFVYSTKLLARSNFGVISHFTIQHLSAVCWSELNFKVINDLLSIALLHGHFLFWDKKKLDFNFFRRWPRDRFVNVIIVKTGTNNQKRNSIEMIKFIGCQYSQLTTIVDQINYCYSFQVKHLIEQVNWTGPTKMESILHFLDNDRDVLYFCDDHPHVV